MANVYDIIIRPIITERSMVDVANKKYVFEVAKDAGKVEIKNAVETAFSAPAAWARPAAGRRPMCSSLKIPRPSSCSRAWCKEDMRNGY